MLIWCSIDNYKMIRRYGTIYTVYGAYNKKESLKQSVDIWYLIYIKHCNISYLIVIAMLWCCGQEMDN